MLPHSVTKEVVGSKRPTYTESENCNEETSNKDYEYFNLDSDIILEDEEEYDVLNNETFGDPLPAAIPVSDGNPDGWEETYDIHNDETFGKEIEEYDWEAEHEKFVNIIESEPDPSKEKESHQIKNKKNFILTPDIIKKNGYTKSNHYREIGNLKESSQGKRIAEEPFKFPPVIIDNTEKPKNEYDSHPNYTYNEMCAHMDEHDEFGSTETLTNENSSTETRHDKWYNNFDNSANSSKHNAGDYSQGYSLFSSGANLLQTAGIHIPTVSPSSVMKSGGSLEKKFDAMKVQPSVSKIPSVSDLEKQWINESASTSKSIINADCFRAYNSALFLNGNHTSNTNDQSPQKTQLDVFRNEVFPNFLSPQKIEQRNLYGAEDDKNVLRKFAVYPEPQAAEVATLYYRNTINYANLNANILNSFTNTMIVPVDAAKAFPLVDLSKEPPIMIPTESSARIIENTTILLDNARNQTIPGILGSTDGVNLGMFPPPPGLTIDPNKMCHVPSIQPATATLQPSQPSSYLTLPPPQVLNGITTVEQQKQLMKMQKDSSMANLSNVDEYAGMMTEREKYWLSGVQLLQINSMDPYKDDYYFTNYQARRKGNRNKNQNTNNSAWKNQHTKDYSPLQFENSLGRVQVGSVVAPRQVIDTYLIESSPKNNGKIDNIIDDAIANTSSRKRKALMLHIENMYSKIMALESLQVNSGKNKSDPAAVKLEFTTIATALREEILNLKDDFKIIMSIKKGKRLVLRFLSFCDDPGEVWYEIFKILDRIIRGDQEHGVLLSYLPYFRAWLTAAELSTLIRLADYFQKNLTFYLQDKFSVSVIANMIEQAEQIYFFSKSEEQNLWMEFVINLAEIAHTSFDHIQKPVVSVKPQILRSHLLKCKKLENGYMSYLLKIFSNNVRK